MFGLAEEPNKTDFIMSATALDNIFRGVTGEKELPEELLYKSQGIYEGVKVTIEIAEGMYHTYAVMPFAKEAKPKAGCVSDGRKTLKTGKRRYYGNKKSGN